MKSSSACRSSTRRDATELSLPGDDPQAVDRARLRRLVHDQGRTLGQAARALGITLDTVRDLLDSRPQPLSPGREQRTAHQIAMAAPTASELTDLYLVQRMSTATIAKKIGVRDVDIARLARIYNIPVRQPGRQAARDPGRDWIHEQYVTRRRSLTDLAQQIGVS